MLLVPKSFAVTVKYTYNKTEILAVAKINARNHSQKDPKTKGYNREYR